MQPRAAEEAKLQALENEMNELNLQFVNKYGRTLESIQKEFFPSIVSVYSRINVELVPGRDNFFLSIEEQATGLRKLLLGQLNQVKPQFQEEAKLNITPAIEMMEQMAVYGALLKKRDDAYKALHVNFEPWISDITKKELSLVNPTPDRTSIGLGVVGFLGLFPGMLFPPVAIAALACLLISATVFIVNTALEHRDYNKLLPKENPNLGEKWIKFDEICERSEKFVKPSSYTPEQANNAKKRREERTRQKEQKLPHVHAEDQKEQKPLQVLAENNVTRVSQQTFLNSKKGSEQKVEQAQEINVRNDKSSPR